MNRQTEHPYGTERVPIVDDNGDTGGTLYYGAAAAVYEEDRRFDGRNMVSMATGSQWDHEEIVCTKRGRYYIVSSSQWQGSQTKARAATLDQAAKWLVRNGYVPNNVDDAKLADKIREEFDQ